MKTTLHTTHETVLVLNRGLQVIEKLTKALNAFVDGCIYSAITPALKDTMKIQVDHLVYSFSGPNRLMYKRDSATAAKMFPNSLNDILFANPGSGFTEDYVTLEELCRAILEFPDLHDKVIEHCKFNASGGIALLKELDPYVTPILFEESL